MIEFYFDTPQFDLLNAGHWLRSQLSSDRKETWTLHFGEREQELQDEPAIVQWLKERNFPLTPTKILPTSPSHYCQRMIAMFKTIGTQSIVSLNLAYEGPNVLQVFLGLDQDEEIQAQAKCSLLSYEEARKQCFEFEWVGKGEIRRK